VAALPFEEAVWVAAGPLRPRPPTSRTGPRHRQWPHSTKTHVPAA